MVVLQKFLSSSKRKVFDTRTEVKQVKGVPVFSRRMRCCSNYMLTFDEFKNFCNRTFEGRYRNTATKMWGKALDDRYPVGVVWSASRPAAGTQRGEQHEPERSSEQQFLPVRTPGGIS